MNFILESFFNLHNFPPLGGEVAARGKFNSGFELCQMARRDSRSLKATEFAFIFVKSQKREKVEKDKKATQARELR
jgi:hypothetical protein